MGNKTRKKGKGGPRLSATQLHRPGTQAAVVAAAPRQPEVVKTPATDTDLVEEYRYVLTDLKKIAWLALAMLVLLIVLAFIVV